MPHECHTNATQMPHKCHTNAAQMPHKCRNYIPKCPKRVPKCPKHGPECPKHGPSLGRMHIGPNAFYNSNPIAIYECNINMLRPKCLMFLLFWVSFGVLFYLVKHRSFSNRDRFNLGRFEHRVFAGMLPPLKLLASGFLVASVWCVLDMKLGCIRWTWKICP